MAVDRRVVVRRGAVLQYALLGAAVLGMRWSGGVLGAAVAAAAVVSAVLLSVVVHEGAHAWVAHRLGLRVRGVEVRGLLAAVVRRAATTDARVDVRVRLAGPLATGALVALCVAAQRVGWPPDALRIVRLLIALNGFTFVATLMGGPQSDGVRAWRAWRAARRAVGDRRPQRA